MGLTSAALIAVCLIQMTTSPLLHPSAEAQEVKVHSKGKDIKVAMLIAQLEQRWANAQKDGDAKSAEPLIAESFVNTDAGGQTYGKEKLLSNLKGGRWEQNSISDVKVVVYRNDAVATGAWAGKGIDGDGTKIDRRERWTDTWVKMPNGKWQCVASQQTEIK
jgi:ketosteroid isomerase-like protein